jgi:hypothetical protein
VTDVSVDDMAIVKPIERPRVTLHGSGDQRGANRTIPV